ncbi:MAG: heme lyase CcmF/NrfE family subunit [Chloroflexi bacterium]|nr:MAG: heme lyase CcmF/NrfE family subunit [Chloroflexota bacterium]
MAEIGYITLLLALSAAVYGMVAAITGVRRRFPELLLSARHAVMAVTGLVTLAAGLLVYAFLKNDFSIEYVASNSSRAQPLFYKVTALWGGQEGSLLFWVWILSLYALGVVLRKWHQNRELMPYVIAILMGIATFFLALITFVVNPFARLGFVPADGNGLNPLLRHPGMTFHPPTLYLGFVGMSVPYAFAMAALITRRTNDAWIRTTRRWTLMAWGFLSVGLLLGGWWAYETLGWGGYWAWDPVENSAFMPWLAGTAFLHSVMIQEKRGMLKVWNMVLIILTFNLTILGTFLTRSGVISSVHSFTQSNLGPFFLGFIGLLFIGSAALVYDRLDALKSENELDSLFSREAGFVLNNLIFMGALFAVFWGTIFPMISEIVTGDKITVGPPYFNKVVIPIFWVLLLLMGIGPLLAWRRSSPKKLGAYLLWPFVVTFLFVAGMWVFGVRKPVALIGFGTCVFVGIITLLEYVRGVRARRRTAGDSWFEALPTLFRRNRRRYGGYLVHIGVILLSIGVIGSSVYKIEVRKSVRQGESFTAGDFTFTFQGMTQERSPDRDTLIAQVVVSKDGQVVDTLEPNRHFYFASQQPATIPSIRSSMGEDIYVSFSAYDPQSGLGTFQAFINPLVVWVWIGGIVFIAGTLIAAWPDWAEEKRLAEVRFRRGAAAASRL